tara:strand:- start:4764 stop:8021 length:3258 start_codon:yes stop_codon:yes gene_type:complete
VKEFNLLKLFEKDKQTQLIVEHLNNRPTKPKLLLKDLNGSLKTIVASNIIKATNLNHLFILDNLEDALYFLDDLNNLNRQISFHLLPSSERIKSGDNNVILERIDALNNIIKRTNTCIITDTKTIKEEVIKKQAFKDNQIKIQTGEKINLNKLIEKLNEFNFRNTNFVLEPGDFSIRGFIIDIFSYSNDIPYRITLDNDIIEGITSFQVASQLSINNFNEISIVSNIENDLDTKNKTTFFSYLPKNTVIWINNPIMFFEDNKDINSSNAIGVSDLKQIINDFSCVYTGQILSEEDVQKIHFNSSAQPTFNKNFEILINHLDEYKSKKYTNIITVSSENQMRRLKNIFKNYLHLTQFIQSDNSLKEGFLDKKNKILLYTDHQIFERHHQYKSKRIYKTDNMISLKDLTNLKKGDYITHFDYGIGMFDGLRIQNSNGKKQESIRIVYKNHDVLYISIHSLHKISKYKEGDNDVNLDKLGSPRWKKLKDKVKNKIKIVAFDLIKLYAKRKITSGFSFSKDTYLQSELEASFIFQDTADQIKITEEIKKDMESEYPMDRLVCGDVGFGKTEIAIRAAFKSVADNKQVAVLVPTTILALQHHKTFTKRLEDFPCNVKYLNRFVSAKETKQIIEELKTGLIDIIIGTHRIISQDVKFKDIGLLIIDEEQKFGVSTKDKLKTLRENIDTLTLTATPIPRTLQFSLMGSRDLSIMTTYPKNRNPIETTVNVFNYDFIKEVILFEVSRSGQVFFVHNRIANIQDIHFTISKMCPNLQVQFAHGQMESKKLENTILDFINGKFDVLITTTIIENGLDIPNANTIIINNAQNFGLADLHQMRGRVGRSNKKAFCYLMTPPFNKMKDIAIKRLNAISNLSSLGDGFNIAMKDLEIRGAGNMLGAEQSGFIEEMGFSNYQKLLDEAITELKETKFKQESLADTNFKTSIKCSMETDLELLIPNTYVSDISERMNLYKRLSKFKNRIDIQEFKEELIDRFGDLPKETNELLKSITLRSLAELINCEKIILKNNNMIIAFVESKNNQSISDKMLNNIIALVQSSKDQKYSIKEDQNRVKLYIKKINNIDDGIKIINKINA